MKKPSIDASFLASLTFFFCCMAFSQAPLAPQGLIQARLCARMAARAANQNLAGTAIGNIYVQELMPGQAYEIRTFAAGHDVNYLIRMSDRRRNGGGCEVASIESGLEPTL